MQRKPFVVVQGAGSDIRNRKAVQRRAKCKLITQKTMLSLIDVAKEKGAKDRVQAYWNTYHCQNKILTAEGRMYAPQCKNRFCTYCCGIRKAELVNKYLPILQCWPDPHFVTLTRLSVPAYKLKQTIKEMNRRFGLLKERYSKRSRRGTGLRFMGLKATECNFNPKKRTYNPHYHILVPSLEIAVMLRKDWLELWGAPYTDPGAQDIRKVQDKEKDLIELIKYETKIFTDPEGKKRSGKKVPKKKIYVRALDNIYAALKGFRIVDRFGFNAPKESKREKAESQLLDEYEEWQYDLSSRDWLNAEHESTLTAYNPPHELEDLLEYNIDTLSE